jgi:hypothetical protein
VISSDGGSCGDVGGMTAKLILNTLGITFRADVGIKRSVWQYQ